MMAVTCSDTAAFPSGRLHIHLYDRTERQRVTALPCQGSIEQGAGLGGGGAGAEALQALVGGLEQVGGVGVAHAGQAAALAEEGEGVLQDLAVGVPAFGGLGVQGGGGRRVAGGLG